MTDINALRALHDAVKAGGTIAWGLGGSPSRKALPMHWHDAMNAYLGSLDAALPGWAWDLSDNGEAHLWPANALEFAGEVPVLGIDRDTPARAWLLAILEALIAQQGAGKGE